MIILGINSAYHESAAAILVNGELVCFVEEERLNRVKHGKPALIDTCDLLPTSSIGVCLAEAGCSFDDVDLIGYSFSKNGRLKNKGVDHYADLGGWGTTEGEHAFHASLMRVPKALQHLGKRPVEPRLRWISHHHAHAASAFLCSPFEESLIVAVDGIGEFDSLLVAHGHDGRIDPLWGLPYPHSLGFLWEKLCKFLGFSEYDACKVMGLASYGKPDRFKAEFTKFAHVNTNGTFCIDLDIVRFRSESYEPLETLFGTRRLSGQPIQDRHADVAAALQQFTEDAMLEICREGKARTCAKNLCLAGGVALNCVVNSKIEKSGKFDAIYVQPAANDAGTALGAALSIWCGEADGNRKFVLDKVYWGPSHEVEDITNALKSAGKPFQTMADPENAAARLIAQGKVVGWFQGRMEAGPRALGNRSLLADPRRPDMREILNIKIKHREPFRPFAPSVLVEKARDWFETPLTSVSTDFMLFAYPVHPEKREIIPAVTHIDGTSRIQTVRRETNPRYHRLIGEFESLTGVPLVLNTSFNDSEPIVMTPRDAVNTFLKTGIDAVIIENQLLVKNETLFNLAQPTKKTIVSRISQKSSPDPREETLFHPIQGPRGLRLALVFGNEAPHGTCPFYKNQCIHCELGSGEGFQFDSASNTARLAFFKEKYKDILATIEHMIIYNSGSTLNPQELSLPTLERILEFIRGLLVCRRVCFDSREPFVTRDHVSFLLDRLRSDQHLSITIGVECQDDAIRIGHLAKRMTKPQIEEIFRVLSENQERTGVDMNILFQPPGIVGKAAIDEAIATVNFGLDLRDRFKIPVDFNFHPYYATWKGTLEFPNHPRAILEDAVRALFGISRILKSRIGDSKLFVGWNDEGHDLQGIHRQRALMVYGPCFAAFNHSQDERDLIL